MRPLPAKTQAAIVRSYEAGLTYKEIERTLGVSGASIAHYARLGGLLLRERGSGPGRKLWADAEVAALVERYEAGEHPSTLARDLGVGASSARSALRRGGAQMRTVSDGKRRWPLTQDYFAAPLSQDAQYLAGLLMADGAIAPPATVALGLASRDSAHLRSIFERLGSAGRKPVLRRNGARADLTIRSRVMVEDLARLGVTPRKSLTAVAGPEVARSADFWRGMIDGDGHIARLDGKAQYPTVQLVGASRALIEQFREWAANCVPGGRTPTLSGRPPLHAHHHVLWRAKVDRCGAVALLASLLYSDSSRWALPRKRALAIRALAWNPPEVVAWSRTEVLVAIRRHVAEHGDVPTCGAWRKRTEDRPATGTVIDLFGTWNGALIGAGYEATPPGGRRKR